jgi:hypothetical protein
LKAAPGKVLAKVIGPARLSRVLWCPDEVLGFVRGRGTDVGFINLGRPQVVKVIDVHPLFPEKDSVHPGDILLVSHVFGQRFKHGGDQYVSLELNDILCAVEDYEP